MPESVPLAELERAIDRKLAGAPRKAPRVQFSPLLADPVPAAKRTRKILVGVSIAVHVLLVAVVVLMPKRVQSIDEPPLPFEIVFTAEPPKVPEMRLGPTTPPKPAPKPKPKAEPPREEPPAPVVETPKPVPRPEPVPEIVKAEPPKPRPEVKVGLLDESPAGPGLAASRTSRSAIVVGAGFDGAAGNAATVARPGRVVETAFEGATQKAKGRAAPGTVKATAFDDDAAAPKKREAEAARPAALETDVEILSKAKPVYTDEARALRIEGDVVLDVVFEASGTVRVLGVVSGLGHGLDEAAVVAARKISFNPAKRDGTPVDHAAKLRVVFRLA